MPPKKIRKSIKRVKKISGGDGEKEVSTVKNFTSTRNPSPVPTASGTAANGTTNNAIGSSPRSSEALYAPKKSSASRLLTVPVSAAASLSASAASAIKPKSGSSIFRYIIILFETKTTFLFQMVLVSLFLLSSVKLQGFFFSSLLTILLYYLY